tara:strand:- start:2899 stop:3306 length:408 start_codon:yes stop_codon:yes gene_type:complete
MTEGTDYTLQQLQDFIGDALSDENITPSQLVEAIETEIRDLLDYHQVAAGKARKVLDLLGNGTSTENVFNFERYRPIDVIDDISCAQGGVNIPDAFDLFGGYANDTISFDDKFSNKYNFKLNSKFINKDNLNNTD